MMNELSLLVPGWWLVITLIASVVSAFAYPLVCRWIADLAFSWRAIVRLVYIASAPVAALLVVVLLTRPDIAGFSLLQHCHGNECGVHSPVYADNSVALIGLATASSLLVLILFIALVWALCRAYRQLRLLGVLTHGTLEGYRTLDSTDLLACCVGLWRPQILLSRGLLENLQPEELTIVLAHERAHAARLDNLRSLFVRWATLLWPAPLALRVRRNIRAEAEQACDLAAARTVADASQVAAVIRKLSKLSGSNIKGDRADVLALDEEDSNTRLAVLETEGPQDRIHARGWLKSVFCLSLSWCVQIYLLTAVSHQLIEWLGQW